MPGDDLSATIIPDPPGTAASGPRVLRRVPLSPTQHAMLLQNVAEPGSGAYIQHAICDLAEHIDAQALERAWRGVVARHALLRTAFRLNETDGAVQDVQDAVDAEFVSEDWRELPPEAQARALEVRIDADRAHDFAPDRAPLWRIALLRFADERFCLVLTYHHALLDGRAVRVALRELFDGYDAFLSGRAFELPSPVPFDAHVAWLAAQEQAEAQRYWKSALAGFSGPTSVVSPHAVRAEGRERYGAHGIRLSRERTQALAAFAREHGITLNTLVLGAWAQLLHRYSGEQTVAFGVTVSLRGAGPPAFRDMVGPLINTLPLCVRIAPDATLAAWLADLRSQWLALRSHAWASPMQIRQWCGVARDVPLLDNLVVFEREPLDSALAEDRPAWTQRRFGRRGGAGHPLTLVAFGKPELSLKLVYERARFDAWMIEPMLEHLHNLLETMPTASAVRLREQRMLSPGDERRILIDWNATARSLGADVCVHTRVSWQAQRTPVAIAVEGGGSALSYADLEAKSARLASRLAAAGVRVGHFVGLCVDRTPDLVVAMLGILKAGGAYVPLDPSYPDERIAAIAADSALTALITTPALAPRLANRLQTRLLLVHAADEDDGAALAPAAPVTMEDPAYAVYTSGSTGAPKGIVVSHRALANHTLDVAETYAIAPGDRRLQFVSLGSDVLIADVFPALIAGGAVILRPDTGLPTVSEFIRFLDERKITLAGLPSGYWHEWVHAMTQGDARFPSALRVVTSGMDAARPDLLSEWRKRAPSRVRWFNAYGPSETTGTATRYEAGPSTADAAPSIPIGRPISNVRIYIVDPWMRPVPAGVPGEILIGGQGVARGYIGQPALTAERFVPDPFGEDPAQRLYRSGDIGRYLPDGNIEFLGRADEQIKIRGFRVEPAEIEAALERLPGVHDAAVVAHGESADRRRLVAYLATAWTTPPLPAELRAQLRASLPDYMLPAEFVTLPAILRTPEGKLDRRALPPPATRPAVSQRGFARVSDPLQYALVDLWQRLLKTHVGIGDDFFALGGDSLLAVQMMDAVARLVGHDVPLTTLFAEPTIARLAIALRAKAKLPAPVVAAIHPTGTRPPLFFLHGDYTSGGFYCRQMASELGDDQPFYAIHPHGIDRGDVPPTIEAMAADRVEHLRREIANGPYLFAGHCAAGLVALEMARQLRAEGEDVPLVVIIDARAPVRRKLVDASDGRGTGQPRAGTASPDPPQTVSRHPTTAAYGAAVARYTPADYAGRVTVFGSERVQDPHPHLGWGAIAARVTSARIPGDHFGAITRYAGALAAALRCAIDDALRAA